MQRQELVTMTAFELDGEPLRRGETYSELATEGGLAQHQYR